MKTMITQKFPFKNEMNSQGKNVVDAAASNIDGFLWRDKRSFLTQQNRPFWRKISLCPP
jgi:hypothetical protein